MLRVAIDVRHRLAIICIVAVIVIRGQSVFAASQSAIAPTASVGGVVSNDGRPVAGASVTLRNDALQFATITDERGAFRFPAVRPASYRLHAVKDALVAERQIDVPAAGRIAVELEIEPVDASAAKDNDEAAPRQIGRVSTSTALAGSGTSLALSGPSLGRNTAGESFPTLLLQLPGATRGGNGRVDINGQRNGVGFVVDGVPISQASSRNLGSNVDADDLAGFAITDGAYPASVGDTFGAVVTIATTPPTGPPRSSYELTVGDAGYVQPEAAYHAPLGTRGGVAIAAHASRDDWALDPPTFRAVHDAGSVANGFLRSSVPVGTSDLVDVTTSASRETYQIPGIRGPLGVPDDTEVRAETSIAVRYRHPLASGGAFSFGPTYDRATIVDGNDRPADLAATTVSEACGRRDCIGSIAATRGATMAGFAADYADRSGHHRFASGLTYRATSVAHDYALTTVANGTHVDATSAQRTGRQGALYAQDAWQLGAYAVDYGFRYDASALAGTDVATAFAQTSPRVKITRTFSSRANAYAYYGRLFAAPPADDLTISTSAPMRFALRPQRDSLYELGGHVPLGAFGLGLRLSHKLSHDVLDDVQLGTTNVSQNINYARGTTDVAALLLQRTTSSGRDLVLSLARTHAVLRGCPALSIVTCPAANDWFAADYAEPWTAAVTQQIPTAHGFVSGTVLYGSGRPGDACAACRAASHVTVDALVERRIAAMLLKLTITNVFNDRYLLTAGESDGIHANHPRSVRLLVGFGG